MNTNDQRPLCLPLIPQKQKGTKGIVPHKMGSLQKTYTVVYLLLSANSVLWLPSKQPEELCTWSGYWKPHQTVIGKSSLVILMGSQAGEPLVSSYHESFTAYWSQKTPKAFGKRHSEERQKYFGLILQNRDNLITTWKRWGWNRISFLKRLEMTCIYTTFWPQIILKT